MPTPAPNIKMRKRILIILLVLVITTVSTTGVSLINTMVINGEKYQAKASAQQLHDAYITAERGNIYDTNMNVLAKSATVWTVYATPNDLLTLSEEKRAEVKNKLAEGLSSILSLEKENILNKLDKTSSYYVEIKKNVNEADTTKVREFLKENSELKLSNYIGIDESSRRYYSENIASTVLGFVGTDNQTFRA